MIAWWVRLWDRVEHPRSLALVRMLLGAVVLADLLQAVRLGLVVPLWGDVAFGGIGHPTGWEPPPPLYALLPATAATPWLAVGVALLAALALVLGVGSRVAAGVLALTLAQLALVLPPADRGIDLLIRNALWILVFARSDAAWSLAARLRTGRWAGDPAVRVPSWPRYLLIIQLVLLYLGAGVSKLASSWTPLGGFTALYIALRDPAFAVLPPDLVRRILPLTQVGTAVTWVWEWGAPLLLLAYHCRDTADRPGRLRRLLSRGFVQAYFLLGVVFHLGTHLGLRLGIFPFAVLALYPAAFHPDEWARWIGALSARLPGAQRPRA